MTDADLPLARRSVIRTAGLSIGAGLLSGFAGSAHGQVITACAHPVSAAGIWSGEYWAKKGDLSIYLYRKRTTPPEAGEPRLPVLFFVHGSSGSSRSAFDLAVPGKGEYSIMNVFARRGFDVWTMDHDGYGRSGSSGGNSDVASSVEDLKAGTELVLRETDASRMHFCGTSSGAIRAGAFAMAKPERVDRLALIAFTYKGTGSPTLKERAERVDYYRTHNRRLRDRAMIRSIFTRDSLAGAYDPAVAEALADAELKFGDQIPTGTYLDMTANLPVVLPEKVLAPVLLVRGEFDGIAAVPDLEEFFNKLPNGDRQFAILPGTAHSVVLAINRQLFWHVTRAFLTMPTPIAT
jgi:pimeloyl-ACP methyl ester carboxylesterase